MASKRPIKTLAFRSGKLIRTGHASSLRGAIISSTRRIFKQRIAVIEILNRDELVLATIRHISIHYSVSINVSRAGNRQLRRDARTAS